MAYTEDHFRNNTVVEHKTESVLDFDDTTSQTSTLYSKKQTKNRRESRDTVESATSVGTTNVKTSSPSHGIFNLNDIDNNNSNSNNYNVVLPEADETNLNLLSQLIMDKMTMNNGDVDIDNELILFDYNLRPISFVLLSIIIIYVPQIAFADDIADNDMVKHFLRLIYLVINLIILFILIPLYSSCIPESTDSIISNGNRNVNRCKPRQLQHGAGSGSRSADTAPAAAPCHQITDILYSIDALYNRAFNIRNINYEIGKDAVNFDPRIHNSIAIIPAGAFLIISNILLLLVLLSDADNTNNSNNSNNTNNVTLLVFVCMILVSFALLTKISVHFTQIKDDIRKAIPNHVYIQRLEMNVQNITQQTIFKKTSIHVIIHAISFIFSIVLWIVYYKIYSVLSITICIVYTFVFIHLVLRIIISYNYAIIIIKQFSRPIQVKSMHNVNMYWKSRNYYFDFILYSFITRINRILTLLFVMIVIALIYIYFMIHESDLPIFAICVYVLFGLLYALKMVSKTYTLQFKHGKMLNNEIIHFKQFEHSNENNYGMKAETKSNDIILLINHIRQNILNCSEYEIAGMPINNTSECIIRFGFIIFIIVIVSSYLD